MAADIQAPSIEPSIMDSDDEYDDFPQTGHPASNLTERLRAQKAIFESWLATDAAQQALKPNTKDGKIKDAADDELSIQSLMAKDGIKIISTPRDYQLELFERAKQENTIAVLDTGSGKTLIAVLLLRHTIDEELNNREAGKPPRISFFLVASVTLVYQQFAVLQTNLDHNITRICGADNSDNWQNSRWRKLFSENKVVVCTAEILRHCLSFGYITMRQINLLIFDEAHHTKKNHAYARIIKDHYLDATAEGSRPRVFGMTASPIDAKVDVDQAATELETLLHSKIATTTDMSFNMAVKRPDEKILRYNALPQPYETELLRAAKVKFGHVAAFQDTLKKCPSIARELGSWCADHYLHDALAEKRLKKYETKVERKFYSKSVDRDVEELDKQQSEVRAAIEFLDQKFAKFSVSGVAQADISSKVDQLRKYLAYQFERPTSQRCIVFVEKRHTARLLDALFRRIGSSHMRPTFLVGNTSKDIQDNVTFRGQVMTLSKFRQGEFNCLFTTSVAEEGLDVPDCNLVVRFDMYRTMIQYVQSRGRARQMNSKFIHMLEQGNSVHDQTVSEIRFQENAMRRFCKSLPEDRHLVGQEDNLEALMEKEKNLPVAEVKGSEAKLTFHNCLTVLATYVAVLPSDTNEPMHPTYVVSSRGSKFIAEVLLPPGAGVRCSVGDIYARKSLAKRSAAFNACLELVKIAHLDKNLMSTQRRRANLMRNAELALNVRSSNQYVMLKKPSVWAVGRGSLPTELWVTLIDFPDGLERQHRQLALLTRTRMPELPTFPLYLNDARESKVVSRQLLKSLEVDDDKIQKLTTFMFRVFKDVFSKKFEEDGAKLSYWLAPTTVPVDGAFDCNPASILDWDLLDEVVATEEYPWTPDTATDSLIGRFLIDKWDGGRKFISYGIDPTLRPLGPVPEGAPKSNYENTVINYTVSLWNKSREKVTWNPDQPVMVADKLPLRYNLLATPAPKEKELAQARVYLCPEPLRISVLPPDLVTSCFVFPAIIHRFESYLVALEACNVVGVTCNPSMALAAVTKDSDNSGEHENEEKINFQRGMGENYERLEFIGDTFLKTATTISTYITSPNEAEADLHVTRMLMLCNKNLFDTAKKLQLYQYVRSIAFSRRLWYPEGLKLLEGKGVNKNEEHQVIMHSLGDKSIADVCEAMIGAAFVSHDKPGEAWVEERWNAAVRAVTKLVHSKDHQISSWDGYRTKYVKPAYQTEPSTAAQRDLAQKVEIEHRYHFTYPRLLRAAFLHPSHPGMYEGVPNYERLEFLGDALLDMASITHLFYRYPDKDPQWLTEHKMAMVSNKFLGAVCVNTGFHKHLRYVSAILEPQIREYATELLEAKRTSGGARDYWTSVSDPPKCLPDIVESYIGAMFIDSDFNYGVVQDFFEKHIKWYFDDMSIYDTFANNHPCTHLYTLLQTGYGCQDYRLMAKEMPPVDSTELENKDIVAVVVVHNTIVSCSRGKSGRYARLRVAQQALEKMEGLTPIEFRAKFGCGCSLKREGVLASDGVVDQVVGADCGV